MITDACSAWVLHKRWIRDTSVQIEFFTQEQGLIRCLQKGARTLKRQSGFQPFTPLWLAVNRRGDACFVREIEITGKTRDFYGHNLFSALYVNELLHHVLQPFEAYPELFTSYVTTLDSLTAAQTKLEMEAALRRFEYQLLSVCGYEVQLDLDAYGNTIDTTVYYAYIPEEGFFPAKSGISGIHIQAFSRNRLSELEVLRAAKKIMRKALANFLDGKPIKARELFIAQL